MIAPTNKYSERELLHRATVEDGSGNVTLTALGANSDTAVTDSTSSGTVIAWLKGLVKMVADVWIDAKNAFGVSLTDGLTKEADSIESRIESRPYKNMSSTGVILAQIGTLHGMYVNSTGGGTIKIWDNASAGSGTVINNTITPAIGWHNLGDAKLTAGAYATITGTIDVTFYFTPKSAHL